MDQIVRDVETSKRGVLRFHVVVARAREVAGVDRRADQRVPDSGRAVVIGPEHLAASLRGKLVKGLSGGGGDGAADAQEGLETPGRVDEDTLLRLRRLRQVNHPEGPN